jgi:four helix bundle protein
MKIYFDHEKLVVYQESLANVGWVTMLLDTVPKSLAVHDQLDRAFTSVPLNIAEENGKFTSPDRCRFFDNARGSALECAACLDVLVAKGKAIVEQIQPGKESLHKIVSMLVGLIRSNSSDRLYESATEYRTDDKPQEKE